MARVGVGTAHIRVHPHTSVTTLVYGTYRELREHDHTTTEAPNDDIIRVPQVVNALQHVFMPTGQWISAQAPVCNYLRDGDHAKILTSQLTCIEIPVGVGYVQPRCHSLILERKGDSPGAGLYEVASAFLGIPPCAFRMLQDEFIVPHSDASVFLSFPPPTAACDRACWARSIR